MNRITDEMSNPFLPQQQNLSLHSVVQIVRDYDEIVECMQNATSNRMEFYWHALTLLNQEMMEISYESKRSRGDGQSNSNNPESSTVLTRIWCKYYDINSIHEEDI